MGDFEEFVIHIVLLLRSACYTPCNCSPCYVPTHPVVFLRLPSEIISNQIQMIAFRYYVIELVQAT